jgi:predicted Zn-dependent peptidase
VDRDVPSNAIYKAYKMCSRIHPDYFATDLLSDILSLGDSSRLYKSLIKEQKLFSDINAYVMGSSDDGLFVISGNLSDGVSFEDAENAITKELETIKSANLTETELQKVKNKQESSREFSETSVLTKAMNLAFAELNGDTNLINTEADKYKEVTVKDIERIANQILTPTNCSTLIYAKK